jgi:hypothetical protein
MDQFLTESLRLHRAGDSPLLVVTTRRCTVATQKKMWRIGISVPSSFDLLSESSPSVDKNFGR